MFVMVGSLTAAGSKSGAVIVSFSINWKSRASTFACSLNPNRGTVRSALANSLTHEDGLTTLVICISQDEEDVLDQTHVELREKGVHDRWIRSREVVDEVQSD